MYDLIIIGMGPGGIAAGIYAKRAELKVLLLESQMPGGILNFIDKIDNYPGLPDISGSSLSYKLLQQVEDLEIPYKLEQVEDITKNETTYNVKTNNETYHTKKIIIATGRKAKKLSLENEDKFLGRGISYCAVCDANFFKNKTVSVVGGGTSALQEALYLTKTVDKLYLIHRRDTFKAPKSLINKVLENEKIEVIYNDEVVKIEGNEYLESITLKSGRKIDTSGLFIYIGYDPNINFLNNIKITDEAGYIPVDDKYESKEKGIYAIGDIIHKEYYQIITAMSDGVIATLNIVKELEK